MSCRKTVEDFFLRKVSSKNAKFASKNYFGGELKNKVKIITKIEILSTQSSVKNLCVEKLQLHALRLAYFLRATAATALSHRNSVRPSVCQTGGSVKNDAS